MSGGPSPPLTRAGLRRVVARLLVEHLERAPQFDSPLEREIFRRLVGPRHFKLYEDGA